MKQLGRGTESDWLFANPWFEVHISRQKSEIAVSNDLPPVWPGLDGNTIPLCGKLKSGRS